MSTLSQDEFKERVAILRRFKQALIRQRDRFRHYLDMLEQRDEGTDPEDELEFHIEMERSIVKEIASFDRTIEPLEALYREHSPDDAGEIPALRDALSRTRDEVLSRTTTNQKILRSQLDAIRSEITSMRSVRGPTLVDVTA